MKQRLVLVLCAALALPYAAATARPAPPRQSIAITDVTVIDVRKGRSSGSRTVVVDNGRIVAINSGSSKVPADAQRVDGRGKFLIPGLVDMHVHLFNLSTHRPPNDWMFPLFVANGVTSVREMRADADAIALVKHWREQLDSGERLGPRIAAAGIAVHGQSPEDAARAVAAAADAGADFIKVFSEVPAANFRAIVDAARSHWLPVVGHAPAGMSLLDAAAIGQRSDEHLMQAYESCSSIEAALLDERRGLADDALLAKRDAQESRALAAFDDKACKRTSKALLAANQSQVPTLVLADEDALHAAGVADKDLRWRYLRDDEQARWRKFLAGYTEQDAALAKQRWPVARKIVAAMHQAGVRILAGTDAPMPGVYPGYSLHEEMALLVDAGLTPLDALRAATFAPAEFLGIAGAAGSVEVGMRADLVLLDADPLKDIHNTQRIDAVVLDGRLLRREALDALLGEAAAANAR